MGFEGLLGNRRLKENLNSSLGRGHISHFYLITGPEGSGKHTLARLLAAAILCRGESRPCCRCSPCRKVLEGNHPDFITVDDPEKKTVPVALVRSMREDMYIRPNESEHKIYLFPRAQDMQEPSQNALLKILEEPPEYGVFLLLADDPKVLLPTVRSRCTELRLQPIPREELLPALSRQFPKISGEALSTAIARSGGYYGKAASLLEKGMEEDEKVVEFAQAYASGDSLRLLQLLTPMEKWKRDQLIPMLQRWLELTEGALACRSGQENTEPLAKLIGTRRSPQQLMQAIRALQKTIEYAQGNVSVGAVCGYLSWAFR